MAKNTICLWYDKDAEAAARFYADTFPDSAIGAVHRALPRAHNNPEIIINPVKIAEAFFYLHMQDRSRWTHELQLMPFSTKPSH